MLLDLEEDVTNGLHCVVSKKTDHFITTAVRTSNINFTVG
jgi:hypothetical protein